MLGPSASYLYYSKHLTCQAGESFISRRRTPDMQGGIIEINTTIRQGSEAPRISCIF